MNNYCLSRFNCVRKPVRTVHVGGVEIGGDKIVVQSMTNTKLATLTLPCASAYSLQRPDVKL